MDQRKRKPSILGNHPNEVQKDSSQSHWSDTKRTRTELSSFDGSLPEISLSEETLNRLLEEAPEVASVDAQQVKRMILALEKKITHNQLQRIKFSENPEKFMESEIELDEELKKFQLVATAPEQYHLLVELNAISSIVGLLNHENIDIVIDVVDLLNELTDVDTLTETEKSVIIVENLKSNQGLEILVRNLTRYDESQLEEAKAIYSTMEIIESLLEVQPSIGQFLSEKTELLSFLVGRIQKKEFDENKWYCAEILSILLQNSKDNQEKLARMNGIEMLLFSLAPYKKKDPPSIAEEEFVENLFDCLCNCLRSPENCDLFLKAEGIELMLIMVKAKKFCRKSALKALDFSLMNNPINCNHFVEALGLKTLFAALMKKGSKKHKKNSDDNADEEHILSIITSMFKHLNPVNMDRLIRKFHENDYEKMERLVDLHEKYSIKLRWCDANIANKRAQMQEEMDDQIEDQFYLDRLEAGLFTLQLVDFVIATLYVLSPPELEIGKRTKELLDIRKISLEEMKTILTDYSNNIGDKDQTEDAVANDERKLVKSLLEKLV